MSEPTLIQVFGTGATQDVDTLTIQKSALASVGLTPSANNTSESLFIAIALLAMQYLNDTNQANNIDQSVTISLNATPSFTNRDGQVFIRDSITVEIDKSAGSLTIDPDNY